MKSRPKCANNNCKRHVTPTLSHNLCRKHEMERRRAMNRKWRDQLVTSKAKALREVVA